MAIQSTGSFTARGAGDNAQIEPQITDLSGGGFAVAWQDLQSRHIIQGEVFTSSGGSTGTFTVTGTGDHDQFQPTITDLSGGGFAVAWSDQQSPDVIQGEVFTSGGASSATFTVQDTGTHDQLRPTITDLSGGGFAVAWSDNRSPNVIQGEVFTSSGASNGSFTVPGTGTHDQRSPTITGLSNGDFAVAWRDDQSPNVIQGEVFTSGGGSTGSFTVRGLGGDSQFQPTITGLSGGDFAVAWRDDQSSRVIQGEVFTSGGASTGSFTGRGTGDHDQERPTITDLSDGGFAVAWQDGQSPDVIQGEVFTSGGASTGSFTAQGADQAYPTITDLPGGRFAVAWQDGPFGSTSIQGEVFTVDNTEPGFASSTSASIDENTTGDVLDVQAGDDGTANPDTNVTYTLSSNAGSDAASFSIDSNSGQITLDSQKNFESPDDSDTNRDYELTVTATDDVGNTKQQNITVSLHDVAETPTITSGNSDSIAENASNGDAVHNVEANVGGPADQGVSYAITSGNGDGAYSIDSDTGQVTVADATKLDHEASSSRDIAVEAREGGQSTSQNLTLNVTDVDETPSFTSGTSATVSESDSNGAQVHDVQANVGGSADAGVDYAITDGNDDVAGDGGGAFAIDNSDGTITVNDADDIDASQQSSFTVTVAASEGGQTATQDVTIDVDDDVGPTLTGSTPGDGSSTLEPGDNLSLTFSEDVALGSGNITITDEGDGSSTTTLDVTTPAVSVSGDTITLDPSSDLESDTNYHLSADGTAVDDTNGNDFAGSGFSDPGVLNFTTADTDPAFSESDPARVTVLEDASVGLTNALEVADISASDTLTWSVDSPPSNGTVSGVDGESINTNGSNSPFTLATSPSYTPNPDVNGSDSFDVKIADTNPGSATQTITVNVTIDAVNDAPSVTLGADQSVGNTISAQTVAGFANVDPGPNESSQNISDYTLTNDNNALFDVQPDIANNGDLTFDPKDGVEGSAVVDVSVTDAGGTLNGGSDTSATKSFTITVDNRAPSVTGASVTDATLTVALDETLSTAPGDVPEGDDFTVSAGESTVSVSSVSVSGSDLTLDLASAVAAGANVTLDYAQDTDIPADSAGNAVAGFTGQSVTNNTTADDPVPPPPPQPTPTPEPGDGDAPDGGGPDDGLFIGDDRSEVDDVIDTRLARTADFENTRIDGAPATRGTTIDRDTGETVEVISVDPVPDGQRGDDDSPGTDVDVGGDVRARVSEDLGLFATRRTSDSRDNLRTVVDRPTESGGSGGEGSGSDRPASADDVDREAFLDAVLGETGADDGPEVVEIIPARLGDPVGDSGAESRLDVTIESRGNGGDDQGDGNPGSVVIVDSRNLTGDGSADDSDHQWPINMSGAGNVVVRGGGSFQGTKELAAEGMADVDNVLGDNSAQVLFFGPGDDTVRARGGGDIVASAGGDDRLFGGSGNDVVRGGAGDDRLSGGAGADRFVVQGGTDIVTDFALDRDRLDLRAFERETVLGAIDGAKPGGSLEIDFGERAGVRLDGLEPAAVLAGGRGETRIAELFTAALGRAPDAAELDRWGEALAADDDGAQVAARLLATDAAQQRFAERGLEGAIEAIYQSVLDRAPSEAEQRVLRDLVEREGADEALVRWLDALRDTDPSSPSAGDPRDRATIEGDTSAFEARIATAQFLAEQAQVGDGGAEARVAELFTAVLGRAPEPAELDQWRAALEGGAGADAAPVAAQLLATDAAQQRLAGLGLEGAIEAIYQSALDRAPSEVEQRVLTDRVEREGAGEALVRWLDALRDTDPSSPGAADPRDVSTIARDQAVLDNKIAAAQFIAEERPLGVVASQALLDRVGLGTDTSSAGLEPLIDELAMGDDDSPEALIDDPAADSGASDANISADAAFGDNVERPLIGLADNDLAQAEGLMLA